MSFWLLPSRFGQFLQKCWPFHQISQAKWKNMSNFSVFWLNFFTYEDKLSKTNKKARFFYFETLVSLLVKWVLPSVKWVLPSVKWVSAFLGEMSFRQNAQKKACSKLSLSKTQDFPKLRQISPKFNNFFYKNRKYILQSLKSNFKLRYCSIKTIALNPCLITIYLHIAIDFALPHLNWLFVDHLKFSIFLPKLSKFLLKLSRSWSQLSKFGQNSANFGKNSAFRKLN